MDKLKIKKDWDKFYSESGFLTEKTYASHKKYFSVYFETISKYLGPESRILEIACGPGKLLSVLSNKNNYRILATDINSDLLKVAEKNVKKFGNISRIKFKRLNCFKLLSSRELKNTKFDGIIHHGLVEHFKDMGDVIKLLSYQTQKADFVIFGLPYYSKRNIKLWDKSGSKVFRSKWLYKEWKNFFVKNFNVIEIFRFDAKADNMICVIKGN